MRFGLGDHLRPYTHAEDWGCKSSTRGRSDCAGLSLADGQPLTGEFETARVPTGGFASLCSFVAGGETTSTLEPGAKLISHAPRVGYELWYVIDILWRSLKVA